MILDKEKKYLHRIRRVFSFFFFPIGFFVKNLVRLFWDADFRQSCRCRCKALSVESTKKKLYWFHGVSVGEILVFSSLVQRIRGKEPDATFLFTTVSKEGYFMAKKQYSSMGTVCYMPFNFPWMIKKCVKNLKPAKVFVSETDFRFNFLRYCKRYGAKIFLVNGKITYRSFCFFFYILFFSRRLFSYFDHLFVQNSEYEEYFNQLGVKKDRITVLGNLKIENLRESIFVDERECKIRKKEKEKIVVIGSTHPKEEEAIMHQLLPLWKEIPFLRVVLVPRHLRRIHEVEQVLQKMSISYVKYTKITEDIPEDVKVILVDVMGVLVSCYRIADISVVGGSFFPGPGGHNILEPSLFGVPVFFGPFMAKQKDFEKLVLDNKAGEVVSLENMGKTIKRCFLDYDKSREMGQNGRNILEKHKGLSTKISEMLF